MGFLIIIILLALFSWLFYRDIFKSGLDKKDLLIGWGIKIFTAAFFLYLFSYHFSDNGIPIGDVGNFLHDGKVLQEFGKENLGKYAQLMAGINADNSEFLARELSGTMIWDYGITTDHINDNRLIIRINSLIHFISFGNNWVHALIFAFLSFTGIILIYRAFQHLSANRRLLWYTLLLAPTFAFWASAITKETLLVLGFGLFAFGLQKLFIRFKISYLIILLMGIFVLIFNKPHFGLVIIPLSIILVLGGKVDFTRKWAIICSSSVLALLVIFSFTPEKINLVDRLSYKQQDLINVAGGGVFFTNDSSFCAVNYDYIDHFEYQPAEAKIKVLETTEGEYKLFGEKVFRPFTVEPSDKIYDVYLVMEPSETYVSTTPINHSPIQLLKNTPSALFNVFIRPLPTDKGSNFKFIVFAENILFLSFLIITLVQRRKLKSEERKYAVFFALSAILLILIIGWSTPIIGAVVRYKMATQLLLLLTAFIIWKPIQMSSK